MPENTNRERDLVLSPNEYCLISDQTKGHIVVYVGPYKTSLANTDQPVVFNDRNKRFERVTLEQAISVFATAPEGWYLVLKNPAKDSLQPPHFGSNSLPELKIGHKVNMPGPVNFALWPGQMVRVIQGHYLHLNQYLIVRVYDEDAARENWKKAVVKPQAGTAEEAKIGEGIPELTMGKQLIIKGTEVSFYIPPTGVEVVRDADGNYLREAVTLERLEYCILLDEDGNKRFIQGPAVVFPSPTEVFIEKNGTCKFKAIELNEISGIYIKVIAPYTEKGVDYKVGQELFITGKDQMIYFPRPEHAIIKYGERELHYAVAIPAGEGRYVLNRITGKISLMRGPSMFLADPRVEVIVRRFLEPKQVALMFPGNQEAIDYNTRLKSIAKASGRDEFLTESDLKRRLAAAPAPAPALREQAAEGFAGDDFTRSSSFTQPRTITLDTKYEGAVALDVWTGYAVLVVGRTGERKVVVGPQTVLLEYDQILEAMELSTGTPKSDAKTIKTAFLRCMHNKVSDLIDAETSDLCRVHIKLSYRVNFEGDPEKWFNVENYVKFLTDHMRSLIRGAVKQYKIEDFYANNIKVVRDSVLGAATPEGKRAGRKFDENGMRIYDLEILDVKIGDDAIEGLLVQAQHSVVKQNLAISSEKRNLEYVTQSEKIKQQVAEMKSSTTRQEIELQTEEVKSALLLSLAKLESEIQSQRTALEARLANQETLSSIDESELARRREAAAFETEVAQKKLQLRLDELKAEVAGVVERAHAVSPDLVAALQSFSDRALAEKMAESMAPLAILGGKSISDVFAQLLKGTNLETVLKSKIGGKPELPGK